LSSPYVSFAGQPVAKDKGDSGFSSSDGLEKENTQ